MKEIMGKYSEDILKNLDKDNINKIIDFLRNNNCDYIESIISDYLDLFTIDYEVFVTKYNYLNKKYENKFLIIASVNMDLFEEFFY